jgi:chemotaxis receptor (MCP) glutamine deamidase CheD
MGYVEEEVKRLTATVEKLESRIRGLEDKAFGGAKQSEEIRMILIGPPGAGAFLSKQNSSIVALFRREMGLIGRLW